MESRSLDFLRRSSQQCSAVHITAVVMGHDYFGAVDECMRSLGEFIVFFKWQFVSPVVLHDAHIASVCTCSRELQCV